MNPLLHWLTSPEWAQLVRALLHSLWQGALIAAALAIFLRRIANPETRYRLLLAALGTLLLTSVVTWSILNAPQAATTTISQPPLQHSITPSAPTGPVEKFVVIASRTPIKPQVQWTAWLALAWLLGAAAMLGRASVKVTGAEQLRRACQPLNDPRITELVAEARRAVKLTRRVRVAVTNQLTSPAVVGVLVPTLILPLSLITTLSPEQLRFVLLHELAHIRRGDYLANLFQLFAEALFFFNPAVWWLSHQIRREREACCDALAIELSGAPADYARTLVSVAETMLNPSPAAAPAFGNDREPSSLADRVQRVLVPGYRPSLRLTWRAMLAALVVAGTLLGLLAVGARQTVVAALGESSKSRSLDPKNIPFPFVPVELRPDFLLVEEAALRRVMPETADGNLPWIFSANDISRLPTLLLRTGARSFGSAEPLAGQIVSGMDCLWRVGDTNAGTNNSINYLTKPLFENGKTNNRVVGMDATYFADAPGWAPMEFGLVPRVQTNGTVCQLKLAAGRSTHELSATIPNGGGLIWATPEGATSKGYRQLVVLRQVSALAGDKNNPDTAKASTSPIIDPVTGLPEGGITNPVMDVIPYTSEDGFTVQMVVPRMTSNTNSAAKPTTAINPATGLPGVGAGGINPVTGLPVEPSALSAAVPAIKPKPKKGVRVEVGNVVEVRADGTYWMGSNKVELAEIKSRLGDVKRMGPIASLSIQADPKAPDDALIDLDRMRHEIGMVPFVEAGTSALGRSTNGLVSRYFMVDSSAFLTATRQQFGKPIDYPVRQLLIKLWDTADVHPNLWGFASDEGRLFVRATAEELKTVERIVQSTLVPPGRLVQDGKLNYEAGRLEDAKSFLESALALEPDNVAAKYYLDLVERQTADGSSPQPASGRQQIVNKLQSIRLDYVMFDQLPLEEVVRLLREESAKNDPEKHGINFVLAPATNQNAFDMSSVLIKTYSPLTDVKLVNLLETVVKSADRPIQYSVEDYGIVFSPRQTNDSPLFTRSFNIGSNALAHVVEKYLLPGEKLDFKNPKSTGEAIYRMFISAGAEFPSPGKSVYYKDRQGMFIVRATQEDLDKITTALQKSRAVTTATTNETVALYSRAFDVDANELARAVGALESLSATNKQEKVREFIARNGVDIKGPGKSVFYNDRQQKILVRATLADLDKIETALEKVKPLPQVNIRARFVEVAGDGSGDFSKLFDWPQIGLSNSLSESSNIAILTDPQYRVVLRALEQREGVEILSTPDVITLGGRQAQVQVVDRHTLAGAVFRGNTSTSVPSEPYYLTGPILDVIPTVSDDGLAVRMNVIPTVTEFIGYVKPGEFVPKYGTNNLTVPIPHLRVRQASVPQVTVWDGQTLVIGGFVTEHKTVTSNGASNFDLSFITGEFLNQPKEPEKKNLYVFITATVMDPAGNRTNPDLDPASLRGRVPTFQNQPATFPMRPIHPEPGKIYDRYDGPKPPPGEKAFQR